MAEQGFDTQYVPSSPPAGGLPGVLAGEAAEAIRPSWFEKFTTQMKLGIHSGPLGQPGIAGAWTRAFQEADASFQDESRGVGKYSAAEANEKYPGMIVPFSEPVSPSVAQIRFFNSERVKGWRQWADRGPETGFAFDFAAGAVQAVDPMNIALNLTGLRALSALGIAPKVGAVFLENLAGNVIADVPSFFQLRKEIGITPEEMAVGTVAGAV